MTGKRKLYPIGIQTFEKIREGGFFYADKTEYVYNLTHSEMQYVFLGRPRRFGRTADETLLQMEKKEYDKRFALYTLPRVKVGITFDCEKHTLKDWTIQE